ncbi:MAG: serine/threonine protein kinase [Thermoleophilaceae bacterium]
MTALTIPVPDGLRCAACNEAPTPAQIAENDYRCPGCGANLGHLDLATSGRVRGVIGWLRQPGDVLAGRYRVRGFLGKGGQAATYLVEDQKLAGKCRAVKETPELFFDELETEILARIHHPAVPDIVDRFTADGMVYLMLEFGGERTLEGVRKAGGGKISLSRLWPWIDQLCDVLAYLHAQRPPIVHRDLKPSNVLLDEDDRVMLIDFGIAKEAAPDTTTRTVARSASHGFSPPEQVMGTGTDERSDVYALGATLYVMLTGEIPPAAHERVAGAEVLPPRQLVPELPQAVEDAILRALELNVARRHATIADFRRALSEAQVAPAPAYKGVAPRTVFLGDAPCTNPAAPTPTSATAKVVGAATPAPRGHSGITSAVLLVAVAILLTLVAGTAWWLTRGGHEMDPKTSIATAPAPAPIPTSEPKPVPSPPSATPASGETAFEELSRKLPEAEPTEDIAGSKAGEPQAREQAPKKVRTRSRPSQSQAPLDPSAGGKGWVIDRGK